MKEKLSVTALLLCGSILSLLLVFVMHGTRILFPEKTVKMQVDILLEDLRVETAEALIAETKISLDETGAYPIGSIELPTAQSRMEKRRDGTLILLPSYRLMTVKLTLICEGSQSEDGFVLKKKKRLTPGARISVTGERMTAEGRILSLTPISDQ